MHINPTYRYPGEIKTYPHTHTKNGTQITIAALFIIAKQ